MRDDGGCGGDDESGCGDCTGSEVQVTMEVAVVQR